MKPQRTDEILGFLETQRSEAFDGDDVEVEYYYRRAIEAIHEQAHRAGELEHARRQQARLDKLATQLLFLRGIAEDHCSCLGRDGKQVDELQRTLNALFSKEDGE